MTGAFLIGRTLDWRPSGDLPGGWVYALGEETWAELSWDGPDRSVRAETAQGVWRVAFHGSLVLRSTVAPGTCEAPRLVFAGGLRRGLARFPDGPSFLLFSQMDRERGPWQGFDDVDGTGVLRMRGRLGGGAYWSEVTVTPDSFYANVAEPLLLLWGGLRILRLKRPWTAVLTAATTERYALRHGGELSPAPG